MSDKTGGDEAQGALVSTVVLAGVPVLPDTEIEATETEKHGQQVIDIEVHRWSLARRTGNRDGGVAVETKRSQTMAWVRTELDERKKRLNKWLINRFSNTYRGWSIALSIVRPVGEDYGTSTRYAQGYEQALLDMCADGLISAADFEALEAAVQKQANAKNTDKKKPA